MNVDHISAINHAARNLYIDTKALYNGDPDQALQYLCAALIKERDKKELSTSSQRTETPLPMNNAIEKALSLNPYPVREYIKHKSFNDGFIVCYDLIETQLLNKCISVEKKVLIEYMYEFAWQYGRLYHIGDADKIKDALTEKFQLPEEWLDTNNKWHDLFKPTQPSKEAHQTPNPRFANHEFINNKNQKTMTINHTINGKEVEIIWTIESKNKEGISLVKGIGNDGKRYKSQAAVDSESYWVMIGEVEEEEQSYEDRLHLDFAEWILILFASGEIGFENISDQQQLYDMYKLETNRK